MLKRFFTVFLGSMAAIWFSILIFAGLIICALIILIGSTGAPSVKKHSVLHLNLEGEFYDRTTPFSIKEVILGAGQTGQSFDDYIKAINLAKSDSKIEGIYITANGASLGLALRQEMKATLKDFKKSGKWVIAYGDNYSQGDYFTSTIADEIYINPLGQLSANGLSASVPFFKNLLDKIGVDVQVIKVGTFKSAVEPFILTEMSDSARLQYDVMLGTMWNGYVSEVIASLKMPEDSVTMFKKMAAAPMFGFTAPELVKKGLFTDTKYAYEAVDLVKKKAGCDKDEELNLLTPSKYLSTYNNLTNENDVNDDHIAVLYAIGDIVDSGSEGIVGDKMAPQIIKLADNENVKGLVLRVNSGGGSAFASEQIWSALEYFKSKGKPFVASMGDVAASGGYYISCGADRIFADPATVTGSIGIFGIIPYAQKLLNDKIGVNFSVVETNPNAAFPQIAAPLTEAQHNALTKSVHNGYDLFVSRVAAGRKMEDTEVRRIAEGRVWAGTTALQIGLVDEMGGLKDAIKYMAEKTDLDKDDVVEYPLVKLSPFNLMMEFNDYEAMMKDINDISSQLKPKFPGLTEDQQQEVANFIKRMSSFGKIQAKMEDLRIE